jgi:hypothetical protein
MKKVLLILIYLLLYSHVKAQTTETFETESQGSTTFTDNGQVFNITSQGQAFFDVLVYSGGGWNGTAPDNRFIDNTGSLSTNGQFTVSSAGNAAFSLKSIYLFLSKSDLTFNVTGSVTITGKLGGVTKYAVTRNAPFGASFQVNNGFTFFDLSTLGGQDNSNVTIDQYIVTVTGNITYVAMDAMRWQQQCAVVNVSQASKTNVSCNGGSNGTASVSASGGTGLTYNWTPGNPPGDGTPNVSGLTAGNWTCTVTNQCGNSNSVTISITEPPILTASQTQINNTCSTSNTGSATVNVSGGTGSYSYSWSPSGGNAATASNLAAGNYTVTITDTNNCTIQRNFTITAPPALTATQSQTGNPCSNSSFGTATVNVSGGTGSYSYSWTPAGGNAATASNLSAGNYTVTITDSNNCSIQRSFTITAPPALTTTQMQNNVTCNGGNNGSATVNVSGGTGTYTYSWAPSGGNSATASNLAAGNYTVSIADSNNCTIQRSFTITEPPALTATQSQTNNNCSTSNIASATVNVSGGTGSYTYSWAPSGGNAATASNLAAGNYTVTIADANNCTIQLNFTITTPNALTTTQSQTNVTCNGGSNGTATVNVSGGTGSYSYSWAPSGGNAATASNLSEGNYTVTVTDANNCSIQRTFTITAPPALTATQSQTNNNCSTSSTGSATVSVSGGTGTYSYSWAPSGGNAATALNLAAGNYTVTITDANNCTIQRSFTITAPPALTATQSQTNATCNSNNGIASVVVSGGTGAYTYAWFPSGGNGPEATGLAPGFYIVFISDANGCSIQKTFIISAATDCSIATTWNGTAWSSGAPVCNSYTAIINGDYNSLLNGEITACSLTVTGGAVVVAGGDNFIIKGSVNVSGGSLTFEQNSNLVQADNITNSGVITYKRNSSLLYGLDYTMWSSPVSGSQTLKDFSPQTLDSRFYVYNTALNAYSNYLSASGVFGGNPNAETFVAAKGYLIRMPDGLDVNTQSVFNGFFTGTPNNGNISIALNTQNNRFNAVGNPYPSPVNIQAFLIANQANLDDGTLYFWRKTNNNTASSYATVTMAAYVANSAQGGDTSGGAFAAGQEANWVINPGQGFLVKAKATAGALNFRNDMRRAVNNDQFFRTGSDSIRMLTGPTSKLWLDITSETNDFGQTAIAYTDVTTTGLDYGYDGRLINDGTLNIYTVVEDTSLAIQAREAFTIQDEVILGYKTSATGNYVITLSQLTGVFASGQRVYLKDNLLGTRHELTTDGPYTFKSNEGTFNNRFTIVYADVLDTDKAVVSKDSIVIYQNKNALTVDGGSSTLNSVSIYDILGRMVYSHEAINATTTQITGLAAQRQVLIVQVTTTNGDKISKKIIY